MRKKFIYGLLLVSSCGSLWAADAFTGSWKLNVSKSTFAQGREAKEVTATVVEEGDKQIVTAKGIGGDGNPIYTKYAMPLKGGPVSYTEGGPPVGTTVVIERVDSNTIDSTSTLNGKRVGTSRTAVSADGKTLTRTIKGVDEKGKSVESVEVYNRQ